MAPHDEAGVTLALFWWSLVAHCGGPAVGAVAAGPGGPAANSSKSVGVGWTTWSISCRRSPLRGTPQHRISAGPRRGRRQSFPNFSEGCW